MLHGGRKRSDAAQLKSDAGGSERLLSTAGAAFYAAAGVKNASRAWNKIWSNPHAIDATDNIDHLTRRALVRI